MHTADTQNGNGKELQQKNKRWISVISQKTFLISQQTW